MILFRDAKIIIRIYAVRQHISTRQKEYCMHIFSEFWEHAYIHIDWDTLIHLQTVQILLRNRKTQHQVRIISVYHDVNIHFKQNK